MMTRMHNLDGVTDVRLAKSARKDASDAAGAADRGRRRAGAGAGHEDCVGS